jgi:uncharacterized surface protein with fasciclin (FAS1) repeats
MNSNTKWVVGVVAVLVVVLGLWWWASGSAMWGNSPTASSTPTGAQATTTDETSGAQSVNVQNSSSSVAAVVAGIPNAGRFNQLLAQSGVSFSGKGPYTVFVATDGAFGRLVPGTINNMTAAELKRTLEYHIVSGKRLDVDAVNNGQVQALSGDTLNFRVDTVKNAVYVNSGYVLSAYKANNGIVYVINSVLVPPTQLQ